MPTQTDAPIPHRPQPETAPDGLTLPQRVAKRKREEPDTKHAAPQAEPARDFIPPLRAELSDAEARTQWIEATRDLGEQIPAERLEATTALASQLGLCRRPKFLTCGLVEARLDALLVHGVDPSSTLPDPLLKLLFGQAPEQEHAPSARREEDLSAFLDDVRYALLHVQDEAFWRGTTHLARQEDARRVERLVSATCSAALAARENPAQLVRDLVSTLASGATRDSAIEPSVRGAYASLGCDATPALAAVWARALLDSGPAGTVGPLGIAVVQRMSNTAEGRADRLRAFLRELGGKAHPFRAPELLDVMTRGSMFLAAPAQLHASMAELPFPVMHEIFYRLAPYRAQSPGTGMYSLAAALLETPPAGGPTSPQRLLLAVALHSAATTQSQSAARETRRAWVEATAPGGEPQAEPGPGPSPGPARATAQHEICRRAADIAEDPSLVLREPLLTKAERLDVLRVLWRYRLHEDPRIALTQAANARMHAETPLVALEALSLLAHAAATQIRLQELKVLYRTALYRVRAVDLAGAKPSGLAGPGPCSPAARREQEDASKAEWARDVCEATSHLVAVLQAFRRLPEIVRAYRPPGTYGLPPVETQVLEAHLSWLDAQCVALTRPEVQAITRDHGMLVIGALRQPPVEALERTITPGGPGPQASDQRREA